jgi:hypothetical protein
VVGTARGWSSQGGPRSGGGGGVRRRLGLVRTRDFAWPRDCQQLTGLPLAVSRQFVGSADLRGMGG